MTETDKRKIERWAVGFGERVRQRRVKAGMTQEGLAAAAGLHRTHTLLIETGKREPRLRTILALAVALKCHAGELIPGK